MFTMTILQSVVDEYSNILMNKKTEFNIKSYGLSEAQQEKVVLNVFDYAFRTLLGWTPKDVYNSINMELLERLKLKELLPYLRFPKFLDVETDTYYIAKMLYPKEISLSKRDIVIEVYKKVLHGDKKKFPKEFFFGSEGRIRAAICLQYAIQNYLNYENIEDLYLQFANNKKCVAWLKERCLYQAYSILFETTLDFLHESLPSEDRSEYLYHFNKFSTMYNSKLKIKKGKGLNETN